MGLWWYMSLFCCRLSFIAKVTRKDNCYLAKLICTLSLLWGNAALGLQARSIHKQLRIKSEASPLVPPATPHILSGLVWVWYFTCYSPFEWLENQYSSSPYTSCQPPFAKSTWLASPSIPPNSRADACSLENSPLESSAEGLLTGKHGWGRGRSGDIAKSKVCAKARQ